MVKTRHGVEPSRGVGRRRSGQSRRPLRGSLSLLVATRKGAFVLRADASRRSWRIGEPQLLGHEVNHLVSDPRDPEVWLLAARTGHLGPTVYRSGDAGRTWGEVPRPPAFPKASRRGAGPAVDRVFHLAPGPARQPGLWWAGTVPHGLFRSDDGGTHWEPVRGFSDYLAALRAKKPPRFFPTPGGFITHSILADPRDAAHLYLSLSVGGTFETEDGGRTWRPLNAGVAANFLPDRHPEFGQDPHCLVVSPADPDRLYQQNHCGVYRLDRPGVRWVRIGKNLPAGVGDIGFPIVAHPRDPDTLWVFPMDGTTVWPRPPPGGGPAAAGVRGRPPSGSRVAHGPPAGDGMRHRGSDRPVPGDHRGGSLGQPGRGGELAADRCPPAPGAGDRGVRAIGPPPRPPWPRVRRTPDWRGARCR